MTVHASSVPKASAPAPHRRHRWIRWLGGLVIALVAAVVAFVVFVGGVAQHGQPRFPSLAATPDPSLHGTVAYFGTNSCVHVVAASAQSGKDVLCIKPGELPAPQSDSKLVGPQLVWRSDGRLEVTMFRMSVGKGRAPTYSAGWQQVVDIRTGAVQQTPTADLPNSWNTTTRPTTNARGQTLSIYNSSGTGKIRITLTEADGTSRTLLSAQGPGEYTYHLYSAFWSPDGQWIAADDGRILVVTPGNPAVTRVLVDQMPNGGFNDTPAISNFAVTSADLLAS